MVQTRGPDKRRTTSKRDLEDEDQTVKEDPKRKGKRTSSTPTKSGRVTKPQRSTPIRGKNSTTKTPTRSAGTKDIAKIKANGNDSSSPPKEVDIKLNKISEQEILTANSSGDLVNLINQLTSTSQDEMFNSYKLKTKMKLQQDEDTIVRLEQEIKEKEQLIQTLRSNKSSSNSNTFDDSANDMPNSNNGKKELFISPIRKRKNVDEEVITREDINQEFDTMGAILDMVQLLTGMRVINYEEDNSQFYFDVVQNNTNDKGQRIEIDYKIIIIKKYSSATEVNYIPTFISNGSPDKELLLQNLPDYFCNNLTFPYNTLSQFYGKMNKALNRVSLSKQG